MSSDDEAPGQDWNLSGSTDAMESTVLQGNYNLNNSTIHIDARRSSKTETEVKVHGTGDPLAVLDALATSMESIQVVFDNHPQLNSIEYTVNNEPRKSKNKKADPVCHNPWQIKECCAKYRKDAEDTGQELKRMTGSNKAGSWQQLASSVWNPRKVGPYKARLRQMGKDLNDYLRQSLTDESSETKQCLEHISQNLLNTESEVLNQKRERLQDAQDKLLKSLSDDETIDTKVILSCLKELSTQCNQLEKDCSVLEYLSFPGINQREVTIEEAHERTIEWAFEDEHANKDLYLRRWLEKGDGIYWVKGHPGSGKSTFMKYVSNHEKSEVALRKWAEDDDLIVAKYFFWASDGSSMQTTLEGLLRTLLYSIFCSDPSLIQKVFPAMWEDRSRHWKKGTWSSDDLFAAFRRLMEVAHGKKFCFFVDGLDEHKGQNPDAQTEDEQSRDVAKMLHQMARYSSVKICAASRSRPAFEVFFGGGYNTHKVMEMQEHTREDIETYAKKLLEEDFSFQRLRERNSDYDSLVGQLADKAEGVWIWIKHAMRHVFSSLELDKTPEEIEQKVASLGDLDDLYFRDLESIHQDCKKQAARIFLMSIHANEPIPILTLYIAGFLTDSTPTTLFSCGEDSIASKTQLQALLSEPDVAEERRKATLGDWSESRIETLIKSQKRHLQNRVQDFMKIRRSTGGDSRALAVRDRLVFSHRTGRDFLDRNYGRLQELVGSQFKTNEVLLKAYAIHTQFVPKIIKDKRAALRILLRDIFYCAALHQVSGGDTPAKSLDWYPGIASDDMAGTDFSDLNISADTDIDDISEESDASSVASNETSPSSKSTRWFGRLQNSWNKRMQAWSEKIDNLKYQPDAGIFQRFIHDPKWSELLNSDDPPPKRKYIQEGCLAADTTTSLWTAVHVLPSLMFLSLDNPTEMNRQRGRSSIWGCWLQMLMTVSKNKQVTDLPPALRQLTYGMIWMGANPKYMLNNRSYGSAASATKILCTVFGDKDAKALIAKALKRRQHSDYTILRFLSHLLDKSIPEIIVMKP